MLNLLPNVETFLSEIRFQTQAVEEISEADGFVFIKLKQPAYNDPDIGVPFTRLVFSLSEKLQLKPYLKLISAPHKYRIPVSVSSDTELHVSIVAVRAEKLKGNYDSFFSEIKSQGVVERVSSEKDGKIVILLKKGAIFDPDKIALIFSTARKLDVQRFIRLVNVPTETRLEDVMLPSPAAFSLDIASLHADRLKEFFHRDIDKNDIGESIKYLQCLGWGEKDFQELGVSRASFFRYRNPEIKGNGDETVS
jgi:hypothetical protein